MVRGRFHSSRESGYDHMPRGNAPWLGAPFSAWPAGSATTAGLPSWARGANRLAEERAVHRRPSILFIMADDHAAKAISAYGSRIITTPGIDRIAEAGMRLDHCYVTNSLCTPSRAAILTGTYNHVNGVTTLATPLDNRWPNVAKSLRAGGYATAIFGKWHLGEGPRPRPTGFGDGSEGRRVGTGGCRTCKFRWARDP